MRCSKYHLPCCAEVAEEPAESRWSDQCRESWWLLPGTAGPVLSVHRKVLFSSGQHCNTPFSLATGTTTAVPRVLQIDYFNNQVIVDLVEQQHKGIIAILDDACMNVGKVTDEMFLEALNNKLGKHAHFSSRKVTRPSVATQLASFPGGHLWCSFEV